MEILNELFNESTKTAMKRPRILFVDPNLIERNPYNADRQTEENIQKLQQSIQEAGLMSPLLVIESNGSYKLIAGEGRYQALTRLDFNYKFNGSEIHDEVPVIFAEEFEDPIYEQIAIIRANSQKEETKEEKRKNALALEEKYIQLENRGEKPKGTKREWIASITGYSESSIRDYLSEGKKKQSAKKTNFQKVQNQISNLHKEVQTKDIKIENVSETKQMIRQLKNIQSILEDELRKYK